MKPQVPLHSLLELASQVLGDRLFQWREASAGADHLVVLATTESGQEVVLKAGLEANVDAFILRLLDGSAVPVPKLLAEAPIDGVEPYWLTIMTPAEGVLLSEILNMSRYLPQLISAVHNVHRTTTTKGAGLVLSVEGGAELSWKGYLLGILQGKNPEFDWKQIGQHPEVDASKLSRAISGVIRQVDALPDLQVMSLLHGDLNPYNVFVQDNHVSGIIDWSYARYGDPLFDFARLRMNPFIDEDPRATVLYFKLLDLGVEERIREQTYYLFNLLEYVNWSIQDHNTQRALHHLTLIEQVFLGS